MSEAKTDNPDNPRWSLSAGCLFGLLWGLSCGIAGVMLGHYWGALYRVELQAQIQAQAADILRAKGRIVDSDQILRPFVLVGTVFGGCFGWSFGWLLTAFIPRRRTRTRRDYLLVVVVGLLPLCTLIAPILYRHLLR
ncbi:MAG TPA: hypothetical protein VGP63_26445 [Planctomycetaceae bacterium]|jgi:hypothetical protein|nr:hypothetical protein [Planctomycetaceae bacterium]